MKKNLSIIFGIFACIACEKGNISPLKKSALNSSFTASMNDRVHLQDSLSSLVLEVHSIHDRRCTQHSGLCEDEGLCSVRFKLSTASKAAAETILYVGNSSDNQTDTALISLQDKDYFVYLTSVNPKPAEETEESKLKEAQFIVTRSVEKGD